MPHKLTESLELNRASMGHYKAIPSRNFRFIPESVLNSLKRNNLFLYLIAYLIHFIFYFIFIFLVFFLILLKKKRRPRPRPRVGVLPTPLSAAPSNPMLLPVA